MGNNACEQLTCGYWNINGHKSKYLGDKLLDEEFLKVISDYDIIGLGEIQSEGKVDIPGFKCMNQKIRGKISLGPKIAGGLGVYVRKEVIDLIELVPNSCDDSIWVKIKSEDIFIGTYYVSPQYSKSRDINFFDTLNEEISKFQKKGLVFIQGDLNARTSTDQDFIPTGRHRDPVEDEIEIDENEVTFNTDPNCRNSEDKTTNSRGKELLDLCKMNKLIIMNGRKTGDVFGKYTCHNWNGSSVVDYFLSPISSENCISSFVVGDYIPWLSDHCIIKTKISLKNKSNVNTPVDELNEAHPGFVWNETSISNYKNFLASASAKQKAQDLIDSPPVSSSVLAGSICDFMLENVTAAKVKAKKNLDKKIGEPWFDKECKLAKEDLNSHAKKLAKSPLDKNARSRVFEAKKSFKKIILAKKRRHRKILVNELQNKQQMRNSKEYWKLFRKISPKNKSDPRQPSINEFQDYFEKLSLSNRPQDIPPLSEERGPLDFIISIKELTNAAGRLKLGKAHGMDIACNEMIMPLVNTHPSLVLKLFNSILESGEIVPSWITGLIVPVFKDGSQMDPGNYRGITLMSCLGKLFLSILNARLMTYVLEKKILGINQLGFVSGNRTSDAHIIINNLVNKLCHKSNKKIFSCFVDFRKAFDLVPRDILLKKLLKHGINGRFFNIIRNIYSNDKACVKLNGKCSTTFDVNIGVRQGCILSPLLFNIF